MVIKMVLVVQLHESFLGECGLNTKEIEKNICCQKRAHYVSFFWKKCMVENV
jgi:hypothetical protein